MCRWAVEGSVGLVLAGGPGAAGSLAIILEMDMNSTQCTSVCQPPGPELRDSWYKRVRETATCARTHKQKDKAVCLWGGGVGGTAVVMTIDGGEEEWKRGVGLSQRLLCWSCTCNAQHWLRHRKLAGSQEIQPELSNWFCLQTRKQDCSDHTRHTDSKAPRPWLNKNVYIINNKKKLIKGSKRVFAVIP